MFKLNESYETNRRILKCDDITSSPAEVSTINTPDSQLYTDIAREDSVISVLNTYLELIF